MSSGDRIILLTGDKNFDTDSSGVDGIPFRNNVIITNKQQLRSGTEYINSSTFELASYPYDSYFRELYVDLNSSALQFKIPSKNMLIQVNQKSLNLDEKVFTFLTINWFSANLTRYSSSSNVTTSLRQSKFIEYRASGIIEYSSYISGEYYINSIIEIKISSGITIPAGDLRLAFFQF